MGNPKLAGLCIPILAPLHKRTPVEKSASGMFDLILGCHEWFLKPRSVQSSRWDWAIFLIIPGTSCLATIVMSLRDKVLDRPGFT